MTTADSIGACEHDTILPVVPMFHANAWGLAHAGVAVGANAGHARARPVARRRWPTLIESEQVTVAAGVPTIWMGVLPELRDATPRTCGPSPAAARPCPGRCRRPTASRWGCPILQAWGMTETSPVASVGRIKSYLADTLTEDEQADLRTSIGTIAIGVDFRVVDQATDEPVPWDGESRGELQVAGPVGGPRVLQRRPLARSRSPTTATCAPATWSPSTPRATCGSWTAPRTW